MEGLDQNRFFIGPYYKFTNDIKVEAGYQSVFFNKDLVDDQLNHLIAINFYYNVPD